MIPRTLFSADHELFRDTVRRFIEEHVTPFHANWEKEGQVPRSLWTKAGEPQREWLASRGLRPEVLRANRVGADPGRRHGIRRQRVASAVRAADNGRARHAGLADASRTVEAHARLDPAHANGQADANDLANARSAEAAGDGGTACACHGQHAGTGAGAPGGGAVARRRRASRAGSRRTLRVGDRRERRRRCVTTAER